MLRLASVWLVSCCLSTGLAFAQAGTTPPAPPAPPAHVNWCRITWRLVDPQLVAEGNARKAEARDARKAARETSNAEARAMKKDGGHYPILP